MLGPDFIIIGAQRCGTTSMYNYLIQHPQVEPAIQKEVHYFDNNYNKGITWYLKQFPSKRNGKISGEASPYYIFHPHTPRRIREQFSKIKLIVLLRNPTDRAFSNYQFEVKLGNEKLSFEDALKNEEVRLEGEVEKILKDETYYSFNYQHFSYLKRGMYWEQLKNWFDLFPKEQLFIIRSEDFYKNPKKITKQVESFLGLSNEIKQNFKIFNKGEYNEMKKQTRKDLAGFFRVHNEKLYKIINRDMMWT